MFDRLFPLLHPCVPAFVGLCMAGSALAQSSEFNLTPVEELKEILGDTALSSGAAVHGVQLRLPEQMQLKALEPSPLMLYLPPEWLNDASACLQTGSIDGRYAGGASYIWQNKVAGPQVAGYTTQKKEYLQALGSSQLAVTLMRHGCEMQSIWAGSNEDQAIEISLASWRQPFDGSDVELLVNGFSSDTVAIAIGGTGNAEITCQEADAPTRAAYNMVCILPLAELRRNRTDKGYTVATLRNYTRGVAGRDVWLKLYLPPADGG